MTNLFCLVCNKSLPEAELSGHVASVHFGFLPFACTSCDFTAAQEAEVLQHADMEGHIPFVINRSSTKPYLTLLSKFIVGHGKVFSVSKNFAGILSGLSSHIAADLSQLDGTKSEAQPGAGHDSETSSERSVSTPHSTLVSNLNHPNADTGLSSVCSGSTSNLPENSSHPVDTPKSNGSIELLISRCESSTVDPDSSISDVVFPVQNVAVTCCALCASNEGFSADQREGHVLQHLNPNGIASNANSDPAEYFNVLAKMWQFCFPPTDLLSDISGGITATTKSHVKCLQCSKWIKKTRKAEHVYEEHMPGFDRFVCTICGGKGIYKSKLERACAASHAGIPAEIQSQPLRIEVFDRQCELCYGHLTHPLGRPAGKPVSASTAPPAASMPADTPPFAQLGSSERRYPSTRSSMSAQKVDRAYSCLQSIAPRSTSDSLRLSRTNRGSSSGRFTPALSSKISAKVLKHRTERVTRAENPGMADRVRYPQNCKALNGRPQKHESQGIKWVVCGACNQDVRNVNCALHVWSKHMNAYKRMACGVCGAKYNVLANMQAACKVSHPESKPIVKMIKSAEMSKKYKQQYLQCFGKLPHSRGGLYLKSRHPNPAADSVGLRSPNQTMSGPNAREAKPIGKSHAYRRPTTKCQLCSVSFTRELRRHVLAVHFCRRLYECSECGYGRKTERCKVVGHIRAVHPGDTSVRVIDRSAKLAAKIQQCLDSCFPDRGLLALPVKGKQHRGNESISLRKDATIGSAELADFDMPCASGYAAIQIDDEHDEAEMGEAAGSGCQSGEEEANFATVMRELLRQSDSTEAVAVASESTPVKTEGIHD